MKKISNVSYGDEIIQDILKNSDLISLTNGELLYPNGYLLVSLDKTKHYSLIQIFSQIRYVLDKNKQVLYIKNIRNNRLEKSETKSHSTLNSEGLSDEG